MANSIGPEKRAAIIADGKGGYTHAQIAERHKVHPNTVGRILRKAGVDTKHKGGRSYNRWADCAYRYDTAKPDTEKKTASYMLLVQRVFVGSLTQTEFTVTADAVQCILSNGEKFTLPLDMLPDFGKELGDITTQP